MLKKALLGVSLLTIGLGLITTGCGSNDNANANAKQNESGRIEVITTFYPMYEFSKQVAGSYANVKNLVPGGVEPHDWEPKAGDLKDIQDADVFVYNGAGLETWTDDVLKSIDTDHVVIVEASKGLRFLEGIEEEEGHQHEARDGHYVDPHVWLDPVNAQEEVKNIEQALIRADPKHKEQYTQNAESYLKKLKELDNSFRTELTAAKRKQFMTQHAAFAYLAKRYGLEQITIAGLTPDQEPTPAKMADIVKLAKKLKIKTIFFETLVSSRVSETIAEEIGAKTDVLNPIEGLTKEDEKQNLDYIRIMQNNLKALKNALNE